MGLLRTSCYLIVFEQLIFYNVSIMRIMNYLLLNKGHDKTFSYLWGLLAVLILHIVVAGILLIGLIERQVGKLLPWLIVNAGSTFIVTVVTIKGLFTSNLFSTIFGISNSALYGALLSLVVLKWIFWIVVAHYYVHLRLKDWKLKQEKNAENSVPSTNTENPVDAQEKTVLAIEESVPLQHLEHNRPQAQNLMYPQLQEEIKPFPRLYPLLLGL